MANWSRWPNQPHTGWRSCSCRSPRDVQERRRAGAGVQVLVGAADGQVGAGRVQADRHRADRVAQVPQHQRAGLVHQRGDPRHVGQRAAAVGHVREADQRRALVHRRAHGVLALIPSSMSVLDQPQLAAALRGRSPASTYRSVGKLSSSVTMHVPARPGVQRRAGQLVQVDRGRVAHRRPARAPPRASVLAEQVAGRGGSSIQSFQDRTRPLAPLLVDDLGDPRRGGRWPAGRASSRPGRSAPPGC